MLKPKVVSSAIVHTNPWYRVRHDTLVWPNGKNGEYFVAEFIGAACVVCVQDDQILVVRQYRHATKNDTIELPMGGIKNSDPLKAAQDELREETGYTAKTWKKIAETRVMNGACSMPFHIFVATDFTTGKQHLDESESGLKFGWISLEMWRSLIREGKIEDVESIAAWAIYQEQLRGDHEP